uniref:ribosomal protein S3 n=1 Tax=Polulichloris maxima TaxID=2704661 RepID=UPI002410D9B6|nr:ribosomal protein S3 [Polulichloris maxima]WDY13225.1 ribosomal protein S3 [Polulichloris maxima]
MGQKVNPQGFRLGVSQSPISYWFAKNRHYSQLVIEDHFLRSSIYKKFPNAGIAAIYIERQVDTIKIDISAARPRQLLGSFSKDKHLYTGIQDLREQLKISLQEYQAASLPFFQKKVTTKKSENTKTSNKVNDNTLSELVDSRDLVSHISIGIVKLSDPDTSAACLAESIVEQLEKRIPFRRAMKQAVLRAQNASVKGIKVQISGRLNGAEIARSEWILKGRVPLHTLRAKVQYDSRTARTIYGLLGVKVWVFNDD